MADRADHDGPTREAAAPGSSAAEGPAVAPSAAVLGQVAAALAHDVRNPLNAMSIHLQLLETRLGRAGLADEALQGVQRSLQALHDGIARVDGALAQYVAMVGPGDRLARPVAVAALLGEAAHRARERSPLARIDVAAPDERWVVDGAALMVALDALLDNAIEATRGGGAIALAARRGDSASGVVEVIDHGEGMTAELLDKASRAGFSTRRRVGLGLKAAHQAVRSMGGSLALRSAGPGHGTTASIHLPLDGE